MGTDTLPIERLIRLAFAATILAPLLACSPALAQSAQKPPQPGQTRAQAKDATPAQPAPSGGDAALKQRVEQLEEQLVDMQVVVGTLESLARGGGAASASPAAQGEAPSYGGGGADSVRLDGLETQVRALAAQIEQLTEQVRALWRTAAPRRMPARSPPGRARQRSTRRARRRRPLRLDNGDGGTGDAIGGLIENDAPDAAPARTTAAELAPAHRYGQPAPARLRLLAPQRRLPAAHAAAVPPSNPADAGNPKQLYETAYGYLMQRDYGAAQSAFEDFLTRYPSDSLAGNAQYWLGEAHFVRGEYKAAAGAFLKGYQNYAGNARAADSLLKLAMSLDRLGQKDAACSSYSELIDAVPRCARRTSKSAPSRSASGSAAPDWRSPRARSCNERRAPIADVELEALFAPLAPFAVLILAVSGGADSLAMMHLVARWSQLHPHSGRKLVVATVDHGLRADSRGEARVGRATRRARSASRTRLLTWTGDKPSTGIQDAAREARYRLLADLAWRTVPLGAGRRS